MYYVDRLSGVTIDKDILGRRIGLGGALFSAFAVFLPSFKGYEPFNGFETALLFLNDDATVPASILYLSSIAFALCRIASAFGEKRWASIAYAVIMAGEIVCWALAAAFASAVLLPGAWAGAAGMAAGIVGLVLRFMTG